jgi:hypothetical protein
MRRVSSRVEDTMDKWDCVLDLMVADSDVAMWKGLL